MKLDKALITLTMATFVAGCASTPSPPREELAAAELAVSQVKESSAEEYAAEDILRADEKLEAARSAMQREDYIQARRMAEQALVDAQFADVRADAARSGEVLAQSEESIEALEREALELSR